MQRAMRSTDDVGRALAYFAASADEYMEAGMLYPEDDEKRICQSGFVLMQYTDLTKFLQTISGSHLRRAGIAVTPWGRCFHYASLFAR